MFFLILCEVNVYFAGVSRKFKCLLTYMSVMIPYVCKILNLRALSNMLTASAIVPAVEQIASPLPGNRHLPPQ